MAEFPIFVDVDTQPPLIVGGGELAAAKARVLAIRAGAIAIAADKLDEAFAPLQAQNKIVHMPPEVTLETIRGRPLVISASGCTDMDEKISMMARSLGVPVNVPDKPDLCTFYLPAIVDRHPVTIAIGTGGSSPLLARRLRSIIEDIVHPNTGRVAEFSRTIRNKVAATVTGARERRAFWKRFFDGPSAKAIQAGQPETAQRLFSGELRQAVQEKPAPPRIYLVGAGPGDPELLTVKALRLLREADAIVYDDLAGQAILGLARREARLIYAGKRGGRPSVAQSQIHKTILDLATPGATIVRLKGGDPFIFGRGGEEVSALRAAGHHVEVVPGISAALAGAANGLIPLTDRRFARAVTFLTGHSAENGCFDLGNTDLSAMRTGGHTIAIYMGVRNASAIATALMGAGWDAAQPVTIAENISRSNERTIQTTLRDIERNFRWLGIDGPAVLFVGACAGFAAQYGTPDNAITGVQTQQASMAM